MLTKWTLQYFKSVCAKTTLDMAPLTIFTGANSSGKSTIIQSLLLTTQTLQNPVSSRSVILNGHILRIGAFNDIVSNNHESKNIFIGFELTPSVDERESPITTSMRFDITRRVEALTSIDCSFSFSANGSEKEREIIQLQPRLEESRLKVNFKLVGSPKEEEVYIRRSKKSIKQRLQEYQLSQKLLHKVEVASLEYEVKKLSYLTKARYRRYYRFHAIGQPVGALLNHFLPGKISIIFDAVEEQSRQLVDFLTIQEDEEILFYRTRGISIDEINNLLNENVKLIIVNTLKEASKDIYKTESSSSKTFINNILILENDFTIQNLSNCYKLPTAKKRTLAQKLAEKYDDILNAVRANRPLDNRVSYLPLPDISELAVDYIQGFFTRFVKYLGPLRDEPKPVYSLAGTTDSKDIGFRGEHTAAVLDVNRNTKVEYIPSDQLKFGSSETITKADFLPIAVLDWLNYMGVASDVQTLDKGKLGHELKVTTTGSLLLHDLTHVGVGVSQVLPILVQSLLAEKGSTLIFEQPELHLHPRVQTRLADFFISMTMLKKQCIVETHSEYLINRLRYQAAASEGEEISKNVLMYFVEKHSGESKYRSVKLNKFGVLEDWPKGFFDENEENARAIIKAAMEKRKNESTKQ
ncbi:AAA domain-containing protein [Nostoc sp. DSM 114160]|jgi:predicted ATPase